MKVAIHNREGSFSSRWIQYCKDHNIEFIIVNCYENDIINQIKGCDIFLWHFHHSNSKDFLFAKQLLFSIELSGIKVFPNFKTVWHFDDKVGQKYLLEAHNLPLINSYVFYSKKEALNWINTTSLPKVFKLRKGAGSSNVKLIDNKAEAKKIVNKAFNKGFSQYNSVENFLERYRKFKLGLVGIKEVLKGFLRIFYTTKFAKIASNEKGYVYFQDFIPNNDCDIRVIVIGNKAFAIKRMVRKGDFRASGSGNILYSKLHFDDELIRLAFQSALKLDLQCVAFDFVYLNNKPLIIEISYGFSQSGYEDCEGYWDSDLNWFEGKFNPQEWMIQDLINN